MRNKEKKIEEKKVSDSTSFVAKGFQLVGEIDANNDVRIEGMVEGDIKTSEKLIVGTTGSIIGNVHAANIQLFGEITGDIFVSGLASIGETGKISGSITADKLQIDPGAVIEAEIKRFQPSDHTKEKTERKENNKKDAQPENFMRKSF